MKLSILSTCVTNNFNDPDIINKINGAWKEAGPHLAQHTSDVFGVYHNYESDYKGNYSLSICIPTDDNSDNQLLIDDNEKYLVFEVPNERGKDAVLETWQTIWKLEESGQLDRTYTNDYEKYSQSGETTIHIAVKS